MLTKRRFLGYSTPGMLAELGCCPANSEWFENTDYAYNFIWDSLEDKKRHAELKNRLLGYPINMNTPPDAFFAWRKSLNEAGVGRFIFNNAGDPLKPNSIAFNTHDFEREIIFRFGRRLAFPDKDTWGFLSHSGTDSNMHGMYMGRTILKARTGLLSKAYFTREAHYSVQILCDLLGMETEFIDTLADGAMDADDLAKKLAANRRYPALVVATIGTTFKGAIDPIDRIQTVLQNYSGYLHLDAALFGGYLPFTEYAREVEWSMPGVRAARYDSIAISCHKFFGFPAPAGLFITTQSQFEEFNAEFRRIHNPEYIHHVPGTITCSRDAVKPAEFFYFSTPEAMQKMAADAHSILLDTGYLLERLHNRFPEFEAIRANSLSNTIYFKKPADWIVKKYSLATMGLGDKEYAHVVVMPHARQNTINMFLDDLETDKRKHKN